MEIFLVEKSGRDGIRQKAYSPSRLGLYLWLTSEKCELLGTRESFHAPQEPHNDIVAFRNSLNG